MKRVLIALSLALVVHAALALVLALLLTFASDHDAGTEPRLDLSSVELSLSERNRDTPEVSTAALPPAPPPVAEHPIEPVAPAPPASATVPPETLRVEGPVPEAPVALEPVVIEEPPPALDLPETGTDPAPEAPPETGTVPAPASEPVEAADQAKVEAPSLKRAFDMKRIYPREARLAREEGDVLLEFAVTERGTVASVAIVRSSGHASLDAAALKAARKATFTPAKVNGRPVAKTVRFALSFRLTDGR